MTAPIKTILEQCLKPTDNWRFFLLTHWHEIIGALKKQVRLERIETLYNKEIITLGVYESVWLQELYLMAPLLIRSINQKLGSPVISNVKFKLIVKDKQPAIKETKTYTQKKLRTELTKKEELALQKLTDPELKKALKKLLLRSAAE
jgi:hypothetical protein